MILAKSRRGAVKSTQSLRMEPTWSHRSLHGVSFSSVANGTHMAKQGLSCSGYTTIVALIVAACAFLSIEPAAAANSERFSYCMSSESEMDCGFASMAQCEATASGGLGVCDRKAAWPREHGFIRAPSLAQRAAHRAEVNPSAAATASWARSLHLRREPLTPLASPFWCLHQYANDIVDCSYSNRSQCEATASGGLGQCSMS